MLTRLVRHSLVLGMLLLAFMGVTAGSASAAQNISIAVAAESNINTTFAGGTTTFTATGDNAVIPLSDLQTALIIGPVVINTALIGGQAGDVDVNAAVTSTTTNALEIRAAGAVRFHNPVNGPLALTLLAASASFTQAGNVTPLTSITTTAPTTITGGTLHTTGAQDFTTLTFTTTPGDVASPDFGVLTALHLPTGTTTIDGGGDIAADIDGAGGLRKTGSGVVRIGIGGGTATYPGLTTVDGGTLLVLNGLTSSVTVADGGKFGGIGAVAGNLTVQSGGTLRPGDGSATPVGTMTVGGSLGMTPGATLEIVIDGANAPKLVATPVGVTNSTLHVIVVDDPASYTEFTIIENISMFPVGGHFAGLSQNATFTADGSIFKVGYSTSFAENSVTLKRVPPPSQITIDIAPWTWEFGSSIEVIATVTGDSPTGWVQFFLDGNMEDLLPLVDGVATYTPAAAIGGHEIQAFYGGDDENSPSGGGELPVGFEVTKITTTTSLTPTPASATIGDSVAIDAHVTGPLTPTGTVAFYDGATLVQTKPVDGSGDARWTTTSLAAGTHTLSAIYSGDSTHKTSTSSNATATISKVATSIALSQDVTSHTVGDGVFLTADVSGIGGAPGDVEFLDGSDLIDTATVDGSGRATLLVASLSPGTHTLRAMYSGTTIFAASSSNPLSHTVLKFATTSTTTPNTAGSFVGDEVLIGAHVDGPGPTGTVEFYDGTTLLAMKSIDGSGNAQSSTSTLAKGIHSIHVVYSGDALHAVSTSAIATVTVVQIATSIVLSQSDPQTAPGELMALTAVVSGARPPVGEVTFFDGATDIGTGTVNRAGSTTIATKALAAGTHTLTAVFDGNSVFEDSNAAAITHAVAAPTPPVTPVAPKLTKVKIKPGCLARATTPASISFQIDAAAEVTYTLERRTKPSPVIKKCPSLSAVTGAPTVTGTRFTTIATKSVTIKAAGAQSIKLSSIVAANKLKPGAYRLNIRARSSSGDLESKLIALGLIVL